MNGGGGAGGCIGIDRLIVLIEGDGGRTGKSSGEGKRNRVGWNLSNDGR